MTVSLDASVIVPILVPEPGTSAAQRYLQQLRRRVLVSDFAGAEVCSAISRLLRTGEIGATAAASHLRALDAFRLTVADRIVIRPEDVQDAERITRRFDLMLKTPDALHAAIALRLGATLVTFDARLALGARWLGVNVDVPA